MSKNKSEKELLGLLFKEKDKRKNAPLSICLGLLLYNGVINDEEFFIINKI